MRALRGHKLHQFYLYQISHLPVKEKLWINYAVMHAFLVRLCKNTEPCYSCPYALTPITGELRVTSFANPFYPQILRYTIPPSIEAKERHTISEINLPNPDNIRLMFS
jgi:hypothetical protein